MEVNKEQEKSTNDLTVVVNNNFIDKHIPGLSGEERNLLMGIMGKLKEKERVTIPISEVIELGDLRKPYNGYAKEVIQSMWDKILPIEYGEYLDNGSFGEGYLFTHFFVDAKKEELTIALNYNLLYFVSNFEKGNFTRMQLDSIHNVKGTYAKKLYIELARYKTTGFYKVTTERLREKLDCPASYSNNKFVDLILVPAGKELEDIYEGLNLTLIRKKNLKKIIAFEFRFKKQRESNSWDPNKYKEKSSVKEVNPTYAKQEDGDMSMEEYAHEVNKLFKN